MVDSPARIQPLGAKIGLILVLLLIVGGAVAWDRIYRAPSSGGEISSGDSAADRRLVLVHGGRARTETAGGAGTAGAARSGAARTVAAGTGMTGTGMAGGGAHKSSARTRPVRHGSAQVHRRASADLPRIHLVRSGENLSEISKRYYGTATRWPDIASANRLEDPFIVHPGEKITIP